MGNSIGSLREHAVANREVYMEPYNLKMWKIDTAQGDIAYFHTTAGLADLKARKGVCRIRSSPHGYQVFLDLILQSSPSWAASRGTRVIASSPTIRLAVALTHARSGEASQPLLSGLANITKNSGL